MRSRGKLLLPFCAMLIRCSVLVGAFAPFDRTIQGTFLQRRSSYHTLGMTNIFDAIRNYFDPGQNNEKADDEDLAAGTSRVLTIPVDSIKPGGLRLFLMLHLMGMQNTPERGSWKPDQPSTEDYVLDFFYHDQSAILSITLLEDKITIDRVGSTPSNSYLMQETVILEGILNELDQCAFDENVQEQDRLLILKEPKDAIEKARDALAFG